MQSKQCSKCINNIFCKACTKKVNGKCSFCNSRDIKFIDVNVHLFKLIKGLRFKCINHDKGCDKILKGINFDIQTHETKECEFRPKDHERDLELEPREFCMICESNIRLIPYN